MPQPVDLLMPKLGLTMEEGRVARWEIAPGAHFSAGDIIVVVETDKIASDVEAPAAGVLTEIIAPEGTTLPVSAPIARWVPDETARSRTGVEPAPQVAAIASPTAAPPLPTQALPTRVTDATRIIATPYARRLAREAGLALADISGTGPHGRIKGADVEAAQRRTGPAAALPLPIVSTITNIGRHSLAEIRVATDALRAMEHSLSSRHGETCARIDFILLACARALIGHGTASRNIAAQLHDQCPPRHVPPFDSSVVRRLSDISDLRRRATTDTSPVAATGLLVVLMPAPIERFSPAATTGPPATLGVGAEHATIGFGPDRTIVERHEQVLTLSYDASIWSDAQAISFLAAVKQFLEEPLHLLAS